MCNTTRFISVYVLVLRTLQKRLAIIFSLFFVTIEYTNYRLLLSWELISLKPALRLRIFVLFYLSAVLFFCVVFINKLHYISLYYNYFMYIYIYMYIFFIIFIVCIRFALYAIFLVLLLLFIFFFIQRLKTKIRHFTTRHWLWLVVQWDQDPS